MLEQKNSQGPDLSGFERANTELSLLGSGLFQRLAGIATAGGKKLRPEQVPVSILDAIGWDETVRWSEWALLHMVQDPELYYVRAEGRRADSVIAEHEAWLRPLLPDLLPAILTAFAYGSAPMVLDWAVSDLGTRVESESGSRNRRLSNHAHYACVHELWPGSTTIRAENDRLLAVGSEGGEVYGGQDAEQLGAVRAFVPVWGKRFGRWLGQGSRRSVYDPWFDKGYHQLWSNRYLERSVDPVRVGYAPEGKIDRGDGNDVQAVALLKSIMQATRNGSSVAFPSTLLRDTNARAWEMLNLEQPDRSEIWERVQTRDDLRIMRATLSPAGLTGEFDESLYFDFIQSIADFAAKELTRIVSVVHRMNHGAAARTPKVIPSDVPKAKKRMLLELLKSVGDAVHHMPDGRVYTLGELVHPEIIEQLGVTARTVAEAAHEPAGETAKGSPGRDRDLSSDREGRRDDARTEESENDTGGENMDRQEQQG